MNCSILLRPLLGAIAVLVLVSPSAFATSYSQTVLSTPNLVGYWRLGETSGTTVVDSYTTAPHNGTYSGTLTLGATGVTNPGDNDTAVTFGGGSFSIPNFSDINFNYTDSFTLETWIKTTTGSPGGTRGLVAHYSGSLGYFLSVHKNNSADRLRAYVQLQQPGAAYIYKVTDNNLASLANDGWHQLVFTHDASVDGGNLASLSIYVDGVLASTNGTGGQEVALGTLTNVTNTTPVENVYSGGGGGAFAGTQDEVAIYKRALSAAEIADHYAARVKPIPEPSSIAILITGSVALGFMRRSRRQSLDR